MSSRENEELDTSQPSRKIPREARPDSCATEALQQFLRDTSPPAEAVLSDTKRLSGASSRHSRGKTFFKSLLRSNPSQCLLPNTYGHASNGSPFPHNCIVLRQAVPGQNQQYYRIVRDSSHFDSLETKSTFRVNYQFQRHDVDGNHDHKNIMDEKNIGQSSKQTLNSASTRFKPRFHIRVRKAVSSSSKGGSLNHGRNADSHVDEECRGRSSGRSESAVDEQVLDSLCHQSIQPRMTADNMDLRAQEVMLRNNRLGDIPQLSEIATGSAFPASEIIKSWSRRRSINSIRSSPGKIQGGCSRKVHSPKAIVIPRNVQNTRDPVPITILQSPADGPFADNRSGSTLYSPTKHSKQLASPVKLSGQKRWRQDLLDKPKPLMKDLVPLALTSNPSKSSKSTLSDSQTPIKAITKRDRADNDIHRGRIIEQRGSADGVSISESVLNDVGLPTPIKKLAAISVDLGLPTTPPPRTPLPAVPRNSQIELSRPDSYVHLSSSYEGSTSIPRLVDLHVPLKSPARMAQVIDVGGLQRIPSLSSSEQPLGSNIKKCDSKCQDNTPVSQSLSTLRTPDLSSLEWPQPPKISTDPSELQLVVDPLISWQKEKDDHFRNRAEKTNSLKRRHLQNASDQIRSMKGSIVGDREGFNGSKAPLATVMELPVQPDDHLKSKSAASSCSPNESVNAKTISSHASSKKIPNLAFSSVKVAAMIKPLTTHDTKLHHRMPRRTVYRSHSTQMTPKKHENRFDSESSASSDESILIHDQQPDLFADSNHQGTFSDNLSSTAVDDEKLDTVQNGYPNNLDEVILDRIDWMVSLMEDRLYQKLSQEISKRFKP